MARCHRCGSEGLCLEGGYTVQRFVSDEKGVLWCRQCWIDKQSREIERLKELLRGEGAKG